MDSQKLSYGLSECSCNRIFQVDPIWYTEWSAPILDILLWCSQKALQPGLKGLIVRPFHTGAPLRAQFTEPHSAGATCLTRQALCASVNTHSQRWQKRSSTLLTKCYFEQKNILLYLLILCCFLPHPCQLFAAAAWAKLLLPEAGFSGEVGAMWKNREQVVQEDDQNQSWMCVTLVPGVFAQRPVGPLYLF